jgi:uncharacterized protein (TIGR02147 family)
MSLDLVQQLKRALAERKAKNPAYSLRAFALYLNVSPSFLSQILNGKLSISTHQTIALSEKLGLDSTEALDSILIQQAPKNSKWKKSVEDQSVARNSLSARRSLVSIEKMEIFKKNWVLNLYVLLDLPEPPSMPEEAAKMLGVPSDDVQSALLVLKSLGAITSENGRYSKSKEFLRITGEYKMQELVEFNRIFFSTNLARLDQTDPDERVIGTETFAMDESDLGAARKILYKCLDELVALSVRSKNKTHVYQVGVQMIPALNVKTKRKKKSA